jgi:hypothetical protein
MRGSNIVRAFWKLPAACCGESSILKRNDTSRFRSLPPQHAAGNVLAGGFSRFSSFRPGRLTLAVLALLMNPAVSAAAEKVAEKAAEKIAVLPTAPYYLYIVYESVVVFWVAILGLLVIIRMKLREIERVQALGVEQDDQDAPLLQ